MPHLTAQRLLADSRVHLPTHPFVLVRCETQSCVGLNQPVLGNTVGEILEEDFWRSVLSFTVNYGRFFEETL